MPDEKPNDAGGVSAPPEAKGSTSFEAGAAKAEGMLLLAGEIRRAADAVALRVAALDPTPLLLVLHVGADRPALDALTRFELGTERLGRELDAARNELPVPIGSGDRGVSERDAGDRGAGERDLTEMLVPLAAGLGPAGALLSAAATAAQYFAIKTSWAGIDLSADDSLVAAEAAGALLRAVPRSEIVQTPLDAGNGAGDVLDRLDRLGASAAATAAKAAGAADGPQKARALAAVEAVKSFIDGLLAADGAGIAPIERIASAAALARLLDDRAILIHLHLVAAGGGSVRREGVFRGIGGSAPAEVAAMAILRFGIYSMRSLHLCDAGTIRAPSPYVDIATVAPRCDDIDPRADNFGLFGRRATG